MKKQLLLGTALLAAISAFPQSGKLLVQPPKADMAAKWAEKYDRLNRLSEQATVTNIQPNVTGAPQMKSSSTLPINWIGLTGSMNVYGVLVSSSKPLQYNNELNAVSFITRKSQYYNPVPAPTPSGAATGAIVGYVSTNWTNQNMTWDSTCIWNNNTNWARYPQGGISNPPGNTNLANSYIVATGPITSANSSQGWIGNFFASKKLDQFDDTASTVPNAQQFISSTGGPYGPVEKVDFARIDFTATDDGVVRTLGSIYNNANGTTGAAQGFRGVRIVKGEFNSGVFVWTSDSVALDVNIDNNTGLPQALNGRFNQAWNDAGTIGYVWYYGSKTGASGNNIGYQPVIVKTTNSGLTWSDYPSIDFNDTATFKPVLSHLLPTLWDSTQIIPFFNFQEGFDGTVDENGQLHIMATVWGTSRNHPDSVGYAYTTFPNADGETYTYAHGGVQLTANSRVIMNRPYIYDFYSTSANAWKVAVVDTMQTEAPGETSTDDGFGDNPWDNTGENGTKVGSDARLQMSRTPGGSKIIYTWAESDTNRTNFGRKWNHVNNVFAKLLDVNPPYNYGVRPEKFNLTNPATGANPYVKEKAQMHNTSPRCAVTATAVNGYTVMLPIKVTNNPTLAQLNPVTHWYASAPLEFTVAANSDVSVAEHGNIASNSKLYPNPATSSANLFISLERSSDVSISVFNMVGQQVKQINVKGQAGENTLPVNITGLTTGIYMVNVKVGETAATKKLIIE